MTRCRASLEPLARRPGGLILWALERLSIGGAWGESTETSHELTLLIWDLREAELTPALGSLLGGRWLRWGAQGLERGSLDSAPPPGALSLLHLKRPARPSAERGGWWAHLGLWLPLDHLGYELSLTHPKGWPIGAFGPAPYVSRSHASRRERRWWIPSASHGQGRVLYLSLTPSWAQLTRWAWDQLMTPLKGVSLSAPLAEGVQAALSGPQTLDQWLKVRVRYHYSPLRRYQPRAPLQSLQLGHGDCKDLSALAHFLFKEAGQPSWFALSSQRPLLSSARDIPSMGWFDHVLLWTPSLEERRALEGHTGSPGSAGERDRALYSSPISSWFDPTGVGGSARALKGRWAYVILSAERGRWVQIGGLPLSGASPTPQ